MFVDNHIPTPGLSRGDGDFLRNFDAPNHRLRDKNFISLRRPFLDRHDHPCVLVNTGRYTREKGEKKEIWQKHRIIDLLNNPIRGVHVPMWVWNATSLRKEDWIELDRKIQMAARDPLVAWADLAAANTYGGFNAYGRATLEYEAMTDPGAAAVDMTGLSSGEMDAPLFTLRSMPLPITHSDFVYDDRTLEISRNSGTPLDSVSGEAAARRVGEMVEDTTIGTVTGITYGTQSTGITAHEGTSTIYGYTNFTYRATKTNLTTPTGSNPQATVADVLAAIQQLRQDKYYGPYMLYVSLAWEQYLDNDYAFTNGSNWATNPSLTLRERLKMIKEIQDIKCLYRLSTAANFVMILVQMTDNVAQAVDGQPITTIQWESKGGMLKHFKVWCIQAPRLKAEYNQNTGILHATTS